MGKVSWKSVVNANSGPSFWKILPFWSRVREFIFVAKQIRAPWMVWGNATRANLATNKTNSSAELQKRKIRGTALTTGLTVTFLIIFRKNQKEMEKNRKHLAEEKTRKWRLALNLVFPDESSCAKKRALFFLGRLFVIRALQ